MDIRIDESGGFIPQGPGANRISAVGALILPSARLDRLYSDYGALRAQLPKTGGEVKGSSLGEREVHKIINLLLEYDVLFDAVVCDVGSHRRRDVVGFQAQQVDILKRSVGKEHHPTMVREVNEMAQALRALPPQLFVQHQMTLELVNRVLKYAPLYLVQRSPPELGSFRWIVDAKGEQLTKYEELWSKLIFPVQQARTVKDPHPVLEGADYSHFEPFLIDSPELSGPPYSPEDERDLRVIDLRKVLMDGLSFMNSADELGLELVDIVTNTLARAMNGRLQRSGWDRIGELMIRLREGTLRMISFQAQKAYRDRTVTLEDRFNGVAQHVVRTARDLVAKELLDEARAEEARRGE